MLGNGRRYHLGLAPSRTSDGVPSTVVLSRLGGRGKVVVVATDAGWSAASVEDLDEVEVAGSRVSLHASAVWLIGEVSGPLVVEVGD